MRAARTNGRGTRRVTLVALTGTTALAIVGGSVLSAEAASAGYYSCLTTNGSTMLVDATGAGNGLVNLGGSSGGILGVATSNGLSIGLLSCTAVVSIGGTAPSAVATLVPTTPTTTLPTVPASATPTAPVETPATAGTPTVAPTTTTPTTTPTGLATVKVTSSATTVYPAKDGYKDRVTFSIKGLTSSATGVKITGKAVLRKGTKVVKTWTITRATKTLSWNGKIGTKIRPGAYRLTVTAWSSDGVKKVSTMTVRVSAKHLITRTVSVRTKDLASSSSATLPAKVKAAFKVGEVLVRTRTIAHVTGAAKLVFTGANGAERTVTLKDGTHTTKAVALPEGFTGTVTIGHRWKQGAAKLTSIRTIFTYKQLV